MPASEGLGTVATLVLGGIGAIVAIYLKEAAQTATQRRVIAWQLFGYTPTPRRRRASIGVSFSSHLGLAISPAPSH